MNNHTPLKSHSLCYRLTALFALSMLLTPPCFAQADPCHEFKVERPEVFDTATFDLKIVPLKGCDRVIETQVTKLRVVVGAGMAARLSTTVSTIAEARKAVAGQKPGKGDRIVIEVIEAKRIENGESYPITFKGSQARFLWHLE